MTRANSTLVRELVSAAKLRISAAGRCEISRILRTAPWQPIPTPGMISRSCRVNSKEGTMPISAAPLARSSAQAEGRRNSRLNRLRCEPCSIPHTNGVVLRKLTAATRGWYVESIFNLQVYQSDMPNYAFGDQQYVPALRDRCREGSV